MDKAQYDVFISYSRKDYVDEHKNVIPGNEVSKIKEALTQAGITYWFDETGVNPGDEFARIIARSIKASRVFVFLSTVNSNQSEWTANEISTAHMLKKKIIPVRIDDSAYHEDVILFLARLSHIDYYENEEKGREDLVRSINAYLAEEKKAEARKKAEEKRRQEELERQRRQQEEEKKRQEQAEKIETEIAALEAQRTARWKTVLQKEQELKLAQVDLEACEAKIQKLQKKLQELREPKMIEQKKEDRRMQARSQMYIVDDVLFKMIRVEGRLSGTFYIGETQVTQALWQAVMGNNPSFFKGPDRPVESVRWNDCQEFIKTLNKRLNDVLAGLQFRLPREYEWEFAAKGGNKSQGYAYSGCNSESELEQYAWYDKNAYDCGSRKQNPTHPDYGTHDVKTRYPNELELYDMSGNVWEWCEDAYDSSGPARVLRGGSWRSDAQDCRVARRNCLSPDGRGHNFGFRLALVQP